MAIAKQLVPGIHARSQQLVRQGKIGRALTIQEAQTIAERLCDSPNIFGDEYAVVDPEIMRLAA